MAVELWDTTGQLVYDDEVYDTVSDNWLREVDPPRESRPSDQEAHEAFVKLVSVSENKQTGLISVSVEHESPDVAMRWVKLMVSRVSKDLRSKDIREAEESIKFLEAQREKTSLVSLMKSLRNSLRSKPKPLCWPMSQETTCSILLTHPSRQS